MTIDGRLEAINQTVGLLGQMQIKTKRKIARLARYVRIIVQDAAARLLALKAKTRREWFEGSNVQQNKCPAALVRFDCPGGSGTAKEVINLLSEVFVLIKGPTHSLTAQRCCGNAHPRRTWLGIDGAGPTNVKVLPSLGLITSL